jgi:hypothetical protein
MLDAAVIIHHIVIIIAFSTGVYTGLGTFYMASFLINEASTPFVNFR